MDLAVEKSKFDDGNFVCLTKGKRWICFSRKVWSTLQSKLDSLMEALKNNQTIRYNLTSDFSVETLNFHGKMYVCFKNKNIYINSNEDQWIELLKSCHTSTNE